MAADIRQIQDNGNTERSKLVGRADSGQHQKAWRVNCASTKQDLTIGSHDVLGKPQADAPPAFDHKAEYFRVHQQINRHAPETPEISRRGIVADPSLDTELIPTDARRDLSSDVGRHREPQVLRRLYESGCHGSAIRDVRK